MTEPHVLVKAFESERVPAYTYSIECPGRPHCDSRIECYKPHKVDDRDADEGPYDCEDGDTWCGAEDYEFHGVMHTWMEDLGWTVAAEDCGAKTHPWLHDTASDLLYDKPPGRYPVRVSWAEEIFDLDLIDGEVQP